MHRWKFWECAASVGLLAVLVLFPAQVSFAQALGPPSDPIARQAFEVLDKHCARCHQEGRLINRDRPAKNFGNILKLDEMAASPHYVLPGNALGSKLFRQIADREMPYDVAYEGDTRYPHVTADDLQALERWIVSLGTRSAATCANRAVVTPAAMANLVMSDLERQPAERRATTRYLTLTHLANSCAGANAMKVYRQGAIKLVNSLSRSANIVKVETIDADASILRLNLADIGWTTSDWETVLAAYPYNMQPAGPSSVTIAAATQTPIAIVRADWFAYAASQPPLYDDLMRLPNSLTELAREQGVNMEANIRSFVAQRAGFQRSGVSQNNRMIERHTAPGGYLWTSYDFAANRGNQNLFAFPLGPGPDGFQHDGGETIFSLPNGFQAYYLSTATGGRLDKAPTAMVRDPSRKDFAVTNGVSCMGCHDQGLRRARDEVRDVVLGSKTLPRDIRDKVEALHPPQMRMDALIAADMKRFTEAMLAAGLDPALKLNGVEPINALAKRYEHDIDLAAAAAELGIDKAKIKSSSADQKFYPLLRRLEQGVVPRDQFEVSYRELAEAMTDQKIVRLAGFRARERLPEASRTDELSLTSDADFYRPGDGPVFTIVSPRDCYLTLTNVDEKGEGTVLLPNRFQQDNLIRAGSPIRFPGSNAPFQYRTKDKGVENIVAVCRVRSGDNDGITHDFSREAFTSVPNYTRAVGRALEVVPAGAAATGSSSPAPTSAPNAAERLQGPPHAPGARQSFRAAIQVTVR
ncbi:DUF4384 domain-containing protein [Bradyrhizobium sp. LHD-71]|uniref:DUF4384 domain-containing protein n=1 Tax=Bradyrhizobium sp. LHD-71 TaxID=3072141 RepID=UPI00280F76FF|nr:DUF4384 domain-containing protein [Bradyrhizobium sp. LHD-71]MDQ8732581.1 DUF4384 domain-containing protein [Bradyrhizobium sp. LHD-71]